MPKRPSIIKRRLNIQDINHKSTKITFRNLKAPRILIRINKCSNQPFRIMLKMKSSQLKLIFLLMEQIWTKEQSTLITSNMLLLKTKNKRLQLQEKIVQS
jgi:hypothetical protein